MQNHRTRPRRARRVALASLIAGALLLVPGAALARPAHATEAEPNWAKGHAHAPGQVKKAEEPPPPPVDTTAPAVAIVSIDKTVLVAAYGLDTATVVVDIADDSGVLGSAATETDDPYGPRVEGLSPIDPDADPATDNGLWTGIVQATDTTPAGELHWRVVVTDLAGNRSVVEGPPLAVQPL
jgi:hypothetical protein